MATDIWAEVDVVNVLAASATQLTTNEGFKITRNSLLASVIHPLITKITSHKQAFKIYNTLLVKK